MAIVQVADVHVKSAGGIALACSLTGGAPDPNIIFEMAQPFVGGVDTPYGTGFKPLATDAFTLDMNITTPDTINTETEACGTYTAGDNRLSFGNYGDKFYFRLADRYHANTILMEPNTTYDMRIVYYGDRVVFMLDETILEDFTTSTFVDVVEEFFIGARNLASGTDRTVTTLLINTFMIRSGAHQTPSSGGGGGGGCVHVKTATGIVAADALYIKTSELLGKTGTVKIMPLGDSITYGASLGHTAADECFGYRGPLWTKLNTDGYTVDFVGSLNAGSDYLATDNTFDMDNEGHMGWNADEILAELNTYLTNDAPDIILLHIGTNDITDSQVPSGIVAEVEDILDAIKTFNATTQVVIARIIQRDPYDSDTYDYNELLVSMVQARIDGGDTTLHLVDMATALTYPDDLIDGLHPTADGYAKMADAWYNKLIGA